MTPDVNLVIRLVLVAAALVLTLAPNSIAGVGRPLDLMMPTAFFDLTEREKRPDAPLPPT